MRHRRRTSTQTISKKKSARTQRKTFPKKSKFYSGSLKFLISVLALFGLLYVAYVYLWPAFKTKLPAFDKITQIENNNAEDTEVRPQLPADEQTLSSTPEEPTQQRETYLPSIQVEILNGCGQQGIAKTLADRLMDLKYDVVNTGNYLKNGKPFFEVKKTRIIDQVNSEKTREKAKELAKQMGLSGDQVETIANPNPIADITVIIGKDFEQLKIFKGKSE